MRHADRAAHSEGSLPAADSAGALPPEDLIGGAHDPSNAASMAGPVRRFRWESIGWGLFVLGLAVAFPIAQYRAVYQTGGTDVPEFYEVGRYILEHGQRDPHSFLKYYLPSIDVAWSALAAMPLWLTSCVWYAFGCLTWLGLLRTVWQILPDGDRTARRHATLVAALLMLPLAMDHLCLGAFHLLMLWLMLAGLHRASRDQAWLGGLLLGVAVWVKLLPIAGVGYLLLKRKWLPAVIAVATVLVVDVVISVAALGPQDAWQSHVRWWQTEGRGASERLLTDREFISEDRLSNQSPAGVVRRVLSQMGVRPGDPQYPRLILADLTPNQLKGVYYGFLGALGMGLLLLCRRSGSTTSPSQWATELAMVQLATVWFSPVAWSYHFTAATAALGVVLARGSRNPRLTWTLIVLWLISMALFGSLWARTVGAMCWMTFFLGAALVWTARAGDDVSSVTAGQVARPVLSDAA